MGKVEYYKWPVLRGTVPLKDQELAWDTNLWRTGTVVWQHYVTINTPR